MTHSQLLLPTGLWAPRQETRQSVVVTKLDGNSVYDKKVSLEKDLLVNRQCVAILLALGYVCLDFQLADNQYIVC